MKLHKPLAWVPAAQLELAEICLRLYEKYGQQEYYDHAIECIIRANAAGAHIKLPGEVVQTPGTEKGN